MLVLYRSKEWNGQDMYFYFFKGVSVHQVCIYVITNTVKTVML